MVRLSAHGEIRAMKTRLSGTKTVSQFAKTSKTFFGSVMIVLVCLMGVFYMVQMTTVATKGYEMEKYEKKLNELKRENQKLQVKLAELGSIENFEEASGKFSKIEAKDVSYVVTDSSVAMER